MSGSERHAHPLASILRERIVLLDGAMGTMIQARNLAEADYRGRQFANHARDLRLNNDLLNITQPQIIEDIHYQYLQAGADIIETNTFNSTTVSMAEYGLEDHVRELNAAGAAVARRAVRKVHRRKSRAALLCGGLDRPHQPHSFGFAGRCEPRLAGHQL